MPAHSGARRIIPFLAASIAVIGLLVACGGSKPGSGGGGGSSAASGGSVVSGKSATVNVKDFSFEPDAITVHPGTKVTWKFDDDTMHNVTADNKAFKSKNIGKGGSYSFTFSKPGTYKYICTIHQNMQATVTVK